MARANPDDISSSKRAQRILQSADALFCDRGFDGTSIRDVAQAAGVNKALVFYYFDSKDRLFEQVVSRYYDEQRRVLIDAMDPTASLPDQIHELLDRYLDFITEHHRYARLIQHQVASGGRQDGAIGQGLTELLEWMVGALGPRAAAEGPRAAKHVYMTLSGAVINYFTYGPLMAEAWGGDPLGPTQLAERRAHIHWLADVLLGALAD